MPRIYFRGLLSATSVPVHLSPLYPLVKSYQVGELIGTAPTTASVHALDTIGLQEDRFISVLTASEVLVLDLAVKEKRIIEE